MASNESPEAEAGSGPPSRRGFLGLTGVISGVIGALMALPAVPFLAAPLLKKQEQGEWIPVGPADQFGEERRETSYTYRHQDGWYQADRTRRVVVGREGSDWVVLSTRCTHLGCGVTWRPDSRTFYCPCHGGEFDASGQPTVPPPLSPLARLEARVNEQTGQLEVKET